MDISGSYTFNAAPDRVWDLLMNPAVLVVYSRLRSLRTRRRGSLHRDVDDRHGGDHGDVYGHGLAGRQGSARVVSPRRRRSGTAGVRERQHTAIALRPDGAATTVDVNASVQTGGPIARVGQRLIGGVAKMMMDKFFACLSSKLT